MFSCIEPINTASETSMWSLEPIKGEKSRFIAEKWSERAPFDESELTGGHQRQNHREKSSPFHPTDPLIHLLK